MVCICSTYRYLMASFSYSHVVVRPSSSMIAVICRYFHNYHKAGANHIISTCSVIHDGCASQPTPLVIPLVNSSHKLISLSLFFPSLRQVDAIGGRRFSEGTSADREIQRTLMELLSQLDGFEVRFGLPCAMHACMSMAMCLMHGC